MPAGPRSWLRLGIRIGVVVLALVLGTWMRVRDLGDLPLHGDEFHTLLRGSEPVDLTRVSYGEILTQFDTVGSHVPLPLLQRLSLDLFGPGVVSMRLVAIVPGLLLLFLAYPWLRTLVGADAAALGTLALALNPMVVFYSRFARGYMLALLFAFALGWAVVRVLDPERRRRASWAVLVGAGALLPWVHLSALGFVLALALGGLALAVRESRALTLRLLGAFALAGGLAFALHLPVLGQVLSYFRVMESEPPPLSWFGVPTLIAGGRIAAGTWLVLLVLAVPLGLRRHRASVVLGLGGLLGPLVLLLATNPRGMDYAWARYVMSALPSLAGLCALAWTELGARLPRSGSAALVLGAALLLVQHGLGLPGLRAPRDGAFSNTYLALHALRAFDEPYPETPEFYRTLARDPSARRIVEMPPLLTRAVLLYRNYALQHGKEVWIGWSGELPAGIQGPPFVRPLALEPGQADYLVLHKDQTAEVPAYFRYVHEELWPTMRVAADDTFMRRQETIYGQNLMGAEKIAPIAQRLGEVHGQPYFEDERILVWKLADPAQGNEHGEPR
jgi:hypothetical protein